MLEEELDPQQAQQIMCGAADAMSSTFKVSYNLVLNATRSSSTNPETIVMQSFFSFLQTEEGGGQLQTLLLTCKQLLLPFT